MPRIGDVLDRESRTVDLEQGDFDRLLGRRDRKQRNRRIRAGAVGVIVALATAIALVRSIESERVPTNPPPKPHRAGEVLFGGGGLYARDPDTGDVRAILHPEAVPGAQSITAAAWSYDHNWVAFRASPGGSQGGSIWIADTAGGAPRQVATDGRWTPWVWSPTEDQLAFVQGRDVVLIDAATGRETDLGTTAVLTDFDGYAVQAMVWSPEGTRIAYSGGPGGGAVYLIDVESGEHSVLVPQPAGVGTVDNIDIDWSPDGAHLAITYEDTSQRIGGSFRQALYLASADGSDTRLVDGNVAAGSWPDWHPGLSVGTAWSPDGTRLAYTTFSRTHDQFQVWTVSVDATAPALIASRCCVSDGGGLVWSPDGSQIAFIAEVGRDLPLAELRHYLVVSADGTGDPTENDELMYLSWAGGWYFCFCYG
jgi:Tol biopolymer transport system component